VRPAIAFPGAGLNLPRIVDHHLPSMDTPCTKICTLDPAAGLCIGCGRTLDEIARWTTMSDAERRRVIAELAERLAARLPGRRACG
jgi:predicted Fe-S protein YdhL (DUF1289 family)